MMSPLSQGPPLHPPPPGRPPSLPGLTGAAAVAVGSGGLEGIGGVGGIEAAARRGTCEALGDLDVPSTVDIVSGVVAGLGKSRLNISRDIGEFSRTSLTSLREANASLKEELKVAHWDMLRVTPRTRGLRTWRPGWPMPPQVPMTGTSRPRSWRRNSKRPRPTRSGRGPLWPIVSHGVHPHPKGLGVRAVGVRAVSPPPQHVACPQSRNDYPHPTPPLQLYAESWCTARCTSWVCKCTMCSLGL